MKSEKEIRKVLKEKKKELKASREKYSIRDNTLLIADINNLET